MEGLDSLDSLKRLTGCYIRIGQRVSSVYVISIWSVWRVSRESIYIINSSNFIEFQGFGVFRLFDGVRHLHR